MMLDSVFVLFPIDLYDDMSYIKHSKVFLVEEELYFNRSSKKLGELKFNILKPIYHRATMRAYYDKLKTHNECEYIELNKNWVGEVQRYIKKHKIDKLLFFDPVDRYLEEKIKKNFNQYIVMNTPRFILTTEDMEDYDGALRQTSFYSWIRKKEQILLDEKGKFIGDKLTFDKENRKSPYKGIENNLFPDGDFTNNIYVVEAFRYVKKMIPSDDVLLWGGLKDAKDIFETELMIKFPIDTNGAKIRLKYFIKNKMSEFGDYQDVFLQKSPEIDSNNDSLLFHSGISPMMNIGLITPEEVVQEIVKYYENLSPDSQKKYFHNVEGFVRQIIGWREFSRFTYEYHSDKYLDKNFFNAKNKLNKSWYTAKTDIEPIDDCIEKAFKYGYLHHIERLMVVGNYMTLTQIDPLQMYKWFMEFALDSYDWVMEYNIYCMASYSDGGKFTTKPYISTSNYLIKMSNYENDEWSKEWDHLFWVFMKKHQTKMKKIGRLANLVKYADGHIAEYKKNN